MRRRACPRPVGELRIRRQTHAGQALILGLFMVACGLAALFFLFNTGQLVREKTRLVNTADAVAYSAAVMDARALNVAAYTNRALVANEVAIAQMLTLASWLPYLQQHGESAEGWLACETQWSVPIAEAMAVYAPACLALAYATYSGAMDAAARGADGVLQAVMQATELAKAALTGSQLLMAATIPALRQQVLQQVADANYAGEGTVLVDLIPMRDDFLSYGGKPVMQRYAKDGEARDDRGRMADLAVAAVGRDGFTPSRSWSDRSLLPTCLLIPPAFDRVNRDGETRLIGYDAWVATDQAIFHKFHIGRHGFLRIPRCDDSPIELGAGQQIAGEAGDAAQPIPASPGGGSWDYSGIPAVYELAEAAREDEGIALKFLVRVTRPASQTATSDAQSTVPLGPRLNPYRAQAAGGVYAGLSASEVFFQRPFARADGQAELPSLFNPFWQPRLAQVRSEERAAATALQMAGRR